MRPLPISLGRMDDSFGFSILFIFLLGILSILRGILYGNFYVRRKNEAELWHFSKRDVLVVGLNIAEIHVGHRLAPAEEILYKANVFSIGPAVLCFICTWTLLRPDDYEPIEGDCHAFCEHQNEGDFPLDVLPSSV